MAETVVSGHSYAVVMCLSCTVDTVHKRWSGKVAYELLDMMNEPWFLIHLLHVSRLCQQHSNPETRQALVTVTWFSYPSATI